MLQRYARRVSDAASPSRVVASCNRFTVSSRSQQLMRREMSESPTTCPSRGRRPRARTVQLAYARVSVRNLPARLISRRFQFGQRKDIAGHCGSWERILSISSFEFLLLAFSHPGFRSRRAPFKYATEMTGAAMSFIKRSDVRNHLSTRSGTGAHLRDSVNQPDTAGSSEDKRADMQGNIPRPDGAPGGSLSAAAPAIPVERQVSSSPATPRGPTA